MRFCSVHEGTEVQGALVLGDRVLTFTELNKHAHTNLPKSLLELIEDQSGIARLKNALPNVSRELGKPISGIRFAPPYDKPPKIWGIGLNYHDHASDLGVRPPSEPASFMKPRTTVIGCGDPIVLPPESKRVTAEAELGVVIGQRCKNVTVDEADNVVFGYVPVLDMTAEDILLRNPRFLTRAKSFDTFFSFGPCILTPDEIGDLSHLSVSTVLNGRATKHNQIRNMTFSPRNLISFHSRVLTFEPGDILSTGTPGAVTISNGDAVECRIDGFPILSNPVLASH